MEFNQQALEKHLILLREDKSQLEHIYDATYRAIFAYVNGIIGNRESAKDITHDVYITIYQKCNLYEANGHPLAWMYAIAKNCTRMYLRKHSRETTVEEHIEIEADSKNIHHSLTVEYYLSLLSIDEKEIVIMRALTELSFKEIATTLDLSLSTVLSKYHRAIKKLQKYAKEGAT